MTGHTYGTARSSDPSTSHEAAAAVNATKLQGLVYDYLRGQWPRYLTTLQIANGMGISVWSVSPRMKPLHALGLLDDPVILPSLNSSGKIRNLQHWRVKDCV